MGQKVNSNSFNLKQKNKINFFNSLDSNKNYSFMLKETIFLQYLFRVFFEQSHFYVKECFIVFNAVKFKVYIYISFLSNTTILKSKSLNSFSDLKCISLFNYFLNKYCFKEYEKIYIFKNLSVDSSKFKLNLIYNKCFKNYNNDLFFDLGKRIAFLLQKTQNGDIVFINFVSKFIVMYHRQRKQLNKFMHFLNLLLLFLYKFKIVSGIRVQLKGRLRGTPRSKKYKFQQGQIPTQTLSASIKYQYKQIYTRYGTVGLKVWLYQ